MADEPSDAPKRLTLEQRADTTELTLFTDLKGENIRQAEPLARAALEAHLDARRKMRKDKENYPKDLAAIERGEMKYPLQGNFAALLEWAKGIQTRYEFSTKLDIGKAPKRKVLNLNMGLFGEDKEKIFLRRALAKVLEDTANEMLEWFTLNPKSPEKSKDILLLVLRTLKKEHAKEGLTFTEDIKFERARGKPLGVSDYNPPHPGKLNHVRPLPSSTRTEKQIWTASTWEMNTTSSD